MAKYTKDNRKEIPDPRPVAVPVGYRRPLTLQEEIKRFVRAELSQVAQAHELETFEEADDFDVDEDPELISPYEIPEAAPEWPGGEKDVDADGPRSPSERSEPEPGSDDPGGNGNDPGGSTAVAEAFPASSQVDNAQKRPAGDLLGGVGRSPGVVPVQKASRRGK